MSEDPLQPIREGLAAWTTEEINFSGECPHCLKKSTFYASAVRNLKNIKVWLAALNPKAMLMNLKSRDLAEFGYCRACEKEVVKCPRCAGLIPAEYHQPQCIKCGKKYARS